MTKSEVNYLTLSNWADGTWHHLAFRRDTVNNTLKIYDQGSEVVTIADNTGSIANTSDLYIGRQDPADGASHILATIDEFRISSAARAACWLEGQYKTQNEPGDIGDTTKFYDVGIEEPALLTFADVTTLTAEMGSQGGVRLNWRTNDEISNLGVLLGAAGLTSSTEGVAPLPGSPVAEIPQWG